MNYTDQSIIPILVVMPSIHYFLKWKLRKITNENIIFCEENTLFTKKNTAFWKYRINEGNTVLTVNVCNQCRIELPIFTLCVLPCQHLSCFVKSGHVIWDHVGLVLAQSGCRMRIGNPHRYRENKIILQGEIILIGQLILISELSSVQFSLWGVVFTSFWQFISYVEINSQTRATYFIL